jgi:hypothetical protein
MSKALPMTLKGQYGRILSEMLCEGKRVSVLTMGIKGCIQLFNAMESIDIIALPEIESV